MEGGGEECGEERSVCVCVCVEEEETQSKVAMKPWVSLFRPCAVSDIEDLQFP